MLVAGVPVRAGDKVPLQRRTVVVGLAGALAFIAAVGGYLAMVDAPYQQDESSHVGYALSLRQGDLPSIWTPVPTEGGGEHLRIALSRPWPFSDPDVHVANNPPFVYLASLPFAELGDQNARHGRTVVGAPSGRPRGRGRRRRRRLPPRTGAQRGRPLRRVRDRGALVERHRDRPPVVGRQPRRPGAGRHHRRHLDDRSIRTDACVARRDAARPLVCGRGGGPPDVARVCGGGGGDGIAPRLCVREARRPSCRSSSVWPGPPSC